MITHARKIDMYPASVPVVVHLSQYDDDFTLEFTMFSSVGEFTVETGTTAKIRGTKKDGKGYSANATINTTQKKVTVTGNQQMTAIAGRNVYELVLTRNNKVLSTANFILDVEPAAMDANTVESESVIQEIGEAVNTYLDEHPEMVYQVDDTLSVAGAAADAKATGDEITDLKSDLKQKGLSEEAKVALLDCFEHVAWIDEHGQDYYDALYNALYPNTGLVSISAVFTQGSAVIYPSTPLNDLKAYLVVTGHYNDGTSKIVTDYSLSGTLEVGTSTITVSKEGKTTTFTVTVSAPYWDYEWDTSSLELPEGMTADEYDFVTEPGVLFAKTPNLDFDHIGNCRIQIEMKSISYSAGAVSYVGSNPQIVIKNAVISEGNFKGIKAIMNFTSGSVSGRLGIGINGTNTITDIRTFDDYHVYDVTAENSAYTLSVDGVQQTIQHNTNTSPYFAFTGLATSARTSETYYGAFIKSIKFKKL